MTYCQQLALAIGFFLALPLTALAVNAGEEEKEGNPEPNPDPQSFLKSLVGSWEGTCRTWFRPGELADESNVSGEFTLLLEGRFLRHSYSGSMKGKPRKGEETIAFNSVKEQFQISWVDDFHMNYAIMFSEGRGTPAGFSVIGKYDVAPDQPPWSWRTVYELSDDDHLTITSFNVLPDGVEAKAVETRYKRRGNKQ